MIRMIFPPKCVLCQRLLNKEETDLCHDCRTNTESFSRGKNTIPFVAHWTALWYYKDDVRKSIQRFKFGRRRHYVDTYGKMLALKLSDSVGADADILSWVPVSPLRKFKRGYDQSQLLAHSVGKLLDLPVAAVLRKRRHTPPQSSITGTAQRRANVMGAYRVIDPKAVAGKRILLLDDVVTTGATASECAKMLLTAGAKEVYLAAVAAASHDKK